jgi:hypothetical protein
VTLAGTGGGDSVKPLQRLLKLQLDVVSLSFQALCRIQFLVPGCHDSFFLSRLSVLTFIEAEHVYPLEGMSERIYLELISIFLAFPTQFPAEGFGICCCHLACHR